MAYTTPATAVAGDVYTAAAHNIIVNDVIDHETRILALGHLDEQTSTAGAGPTSGATELTLFTSTVTLVTGRKYRHSYSLQFTGTNATDIFNISLKDGATSLATQRQSCERNGIQQTVSGFFSSVTGTGSKTYTLTLTRIAGSGTASLLAGPLSLFVIDVIDV